MRILATSQKYSKEQANCTIIILSYKRLERFFICFNCLVSAIRNSTYAVDVIIMDNSNDGSLLAPLQRMCSRLTIIRKLVYSHHPSDNQSVLRNKALEFIESNCEYVAFLDSDIYLEKKTLSFCIKYLDISINIAAIAPPLISYFGGKHNNARKNHENIVMPSKIDLELNKPVNGFLPSLMLRGMFIIRNSCLKQYFKNKAWIESFEIWQNVPFFLTLKENGQLFGYLVQNTFGALHDERPNKYSIKSKMADWSVQTIKSIILLFLRNQLWRKKQQKLNKRFIYTMQSVLHEHINDISSHGAIQVCLKIAKAISKDKAEAYKEFKEIEVEVKEKSILDVIKVLRNENWDKLREIQSYNLDQVM